MTRGQRRAHLAAWFIAGPAALVILVLALLARAPASGAEASGAEPAPDGLERAGAEP